MTNEILGKAMAKRNKSGHFYNINQVTVDWATKTDLKFIRQSGCNQLMYQEVPLDNLGLTN